MRTIADGHGMALAHLSRLRTVHEWCVCVDEHLQGYKLVASRSTIAILSSNSKEDETGAVSHTSNGAAGRPGFGHIG